MRIARIRRSGLQSLLCGFATLMVAFSLSACTTTPSQRPVSVVDVSTSPQQETTAPEPTPLIETTPEPEVTSPVASIPTHEYGWILTQPESIRSTAWLQQAAIEGLSHVQLDTDLIGSIDEIPFSPERQQSIRTFVQACDSAGIRVFLRANELNMDPGIFRFHPADPFTAAREAAYRNVFTLIPELDGIVLSLSDAITPPWEGDLPPGAEMMFPMQRIRFVVEMIHRVVVEQNERELIIALGTEDERQRRWVFDALVSAGLQDIPVQSMSSQEDASPEPLSTNPRWAIVDAVGYGVGGTGSFSVLGDLQNQSRLLQEGALQGTVAYIDGPGGSGILSAQSYNRAALSALQMPESFVEQGFREQWLQQRYGIAPGTREAAVLNRVYASASTWGDSLLRFGGTESTEWVLAELPPIEAGTTISPPVRTEPVTPIERVQITALAQETWEVMESIEATRQEILSIRNYLRPADYNSLIQRLNQTTMVATVHSHMKQIVATFPVWKRTWNENEALVLEGHLRAMEQLASRITSPVLSPNGALTPVRLNQWCASYREQFPRVLVGAHTRDWNRLRSIRIQQTGPTQVMLSFTTDRPSQIEITASAGEVRLSSTPTDFEHRVQIGGLRPGESYWVQVRATDAQGEVTYSSVRTFALEPESMM